MNCRWYILPDNTKYKTDKHFPKPFIAESVKRFVAIVNYWGQHIKNFVNYYYNK